MIKGGYTNIQWLRIILLALAFVFLCPELDSAKPKVKAKPKGVPVSSVNLKIAKKVPISKGITYYNVFIGNENLKMSAHVIEVDVTNPVNKIIFMKGNNRTSELERLIDMINRYNKNSLFRVIAAVNGSFWQYFHNYPIGPTVVNGEVVEINNYKKWTSAYFDEQNKMYIDKISVTGIMKFGKKKKVLINNVNRRNSRKGVCLYNRFGGDVIPYISKNKINRAMKNAIEDNDYKDLTDREFDSLEYRNMILESQLDSAMDKNLVKICARYIDMPALNKDVPLVVTNISKGIVKMPENGIVITCGDNVPKSYIPKTGDKIFVRFSTSSLKKVKFLHAVTGTPRLVRKGVPKHEAEIEGTKSKNFIKSELPRTAIGTSKDKKKIFLVTFEGNNPGAGKKGASLAGEALAMRRIGAFDAVNLDGGGSSNMIVNGKNVMSKADPNKTRRLSIGIGVGFRKKK